MLRIWDYDVVVRHVSAEPYASIYFKAISETMDFDQLSALTILQNTGGLEQRWQEGASTAFRKNSCIRFESDLEPDDFEDKLKKLLDFLEQDSAGIQSLIQNASGCIQVAIGFPQRQYYAGWSTP